MKPKKNPHADLNNYSTTFLLIGLVAVLIFFWRAIELKTFEKELGQDELKITGTEDEETLEVNVEDIKLPPPPPPVVVPEVVVVEDEKEVKQEVFDLSSEDEEDEPTKEPDKIEVDDDAEEEDIEVAFQFIQNPPIYPGCEGKTGAKAIKDCMSKKVKAFVNKNFDKEIASDMGISGRIKIMTQFTIDKTGKVTNIRARSKYKELTKEAKRVIRKLPRVKPGQQRNRNVKVTYTLPIIFQIEEE
jgi:protein TonB